MALFYVFAPKKCYKPCLQALLAFILGRFGGILVIKVGLRFCRSQN